MILPPVGVAVDSLPFGGAAGVEPAVKASHVVSTLQVVENGRVQSFACPPRPGMGQLPPPEPTSLRDRTRDRIRSIAKPKTAQKAKMIPMEKVFGQ